MLGSKLLYALLIAAVIAAGILAQPQITGFFAFITGSSSRLEIWDSADIQGGGRNAFIKEQTVFYANFTRISDGTPISGGSTSCNIGFNITGYWSSPAAMTYNASSGLYEYNRTFPLMRNYTWNVTCDGTSLGQDRLGIPDNTTVYRYEWWNNSWRYRLRILFENGDYNVTNWPVEEDVNFTDVLRQLGANGTFDKNSTRLVEYNLTGGPVHEIPGQFDLGDGYDAAQNAAGTYVFIANGTVGGNASRTFYLYFDTMDNGPRPEPSYATNLSYIWSGDELHFNATKLHFRMDTNRSENTSGLFEVEDYPSIFGIIFYAPTEGDKTIEYMQYSNGTDDLGFFIADNVTIVSGPVRMTIIQRGNETAWSRNDLPTGESEITKKYYIYNRAGPEGPGTFIKMEQIFESLVPYNISRQSTDAGSIAFDVNRGFSSGVLLYSGSDTDPYSYYYTIGNGGEVVGVINIEEAGGSFAANRSQTLGRVGIHLSNSTIAPYGSMRELALIYFGGTSGQNEFLGIKNALAGQPSASLSGYEQLPLESYTETDYVSFKVANDIYNRNETILLTVNVTYDPYGLLDHVNLTMDNGTTGLADDINITMYDDGTHGDQSAGDRVYTNYYNITNYANLGGWKATASVFDKYMVLLNQSLKYFIVTKTLFVNTTVLNKYGNVDRVVNATADVMNFRQDVWQPNVTSLNCSIMSGGTKIGEVHPSNITNYNNGSYRMNFTAPSFLGSFFLNCTAVKNGNDGYEADDFYAEEVKTYVIITAAPANYTTQNVTWFNNESFLLTVNSTNVANGTAYNSTVAIQLPPNMTSNGTSTFCPGVHIPISSSCVVNFNLTVLKTTAPANFTLNVSVTWNNSNGQLGYNATSMNVTVAPTYILDVLQGNISGVVAAGRMKNIENITVRSYGNAPLQNVRYNFTGFPNEFNFSFVPAYMPTLSAGNSTQVRVYLEVADGYPPEIYTGILNVTTDNDGYELLMTNISVSGTNMTITASPGNFTAENITHYVSQNFTLSVNTTNTENGTAYGVNITLQFSNQSIYTTNSTLYQCGNKVKSQYCSGSFAIIISNGTAPGNYTINVSVLWDNPEIGIRSNSTFVNITVLPNVNLTIPENNVSGNVTHGATTVIGSFTMNSTGNDKVKGIQFILLDPNQELRNFPITVTPNLTQTSGGNLSGGAAVKINVSVTVPLSYPPGTYSGMLNVTTSNSGYKMLDVNVTVPASRTWFIQDPLSRSCEHAESPLSGTPCNITVNNTGNVNISFSITPATSPSSMYNYTWTEVVNFEVGNQSTYRFSVFYDVNSVNLTFYNASYQLSGQQASPSSLNFSVVLTPFVKPLIAVSIAPAMLPQLNTTQILVYVTDQGGFAGINRTLVNVSRPDGTLDRIQMRHIPGTQNPYIYQEFYPVDPTDGTWGSTVRKGNYSVSVYSEDNLGLNETKNSSFYVYTKLSVSVRTSRLSGQYYQGEKGTITYSVTDAEGFDLSGVNATVGITDPTSRSVGVNSATFLTNSLGEPPAFPNFELYSDSPTGGYNITAVSSYNDTALGLVVTNMTISNFTVVEKKPGMFTLDLSAPAESSTSDGLNVMGTVTDGVTNMDADSALVSLYDSLGNAILTNQPMTHESTGRYSRYYNTSVSSNQGNWRWLVTVSKNGNVISKDIFTRLVGGPFDVRDISIIDNTVPDLSISVVIENTGSVSQDAFVQWNLTRTDTGETLDAGFDTKMIDGDSEITHTISPSTSYIGEVRITFLVTYSGTEKAGAYEIFNTQAGGPPKPPGEKPGGAGGAGGAGGGGGGAPPMPRIAIVDYPDEMATEIGWTQYPSVTVNNTGNVILHNVQLLIPGIPATWFTVDPVLMPLLRPGESQTFVIKLVVPSGIEPKQYFGVFNASSNETYAEKLTSVVVFGSREELVRYQLQKLKEALEELKADVKAEEERGVLDLTRVNDLIVEIEHQIDMTEGYLTAKMYDQALESVMTGWRLLDRARELLRTAPAARPVTILAIPDWMLMLLLILVIVALVLVMIMKKYRKKLDRMFKKELPAETRAAAEMTAVGPSVGEAFSQAEERKAASREAEREKLRKLIALLEKEYHEGIISEKAFGELKKRNEEKLKALGS